MRRAIAATAVVILVGALIAIAPAQAARDIRALAGLNNVNTNPLTKAVTVAGILEHQRAFQRIANQNDGNRASGLAGHEKSVNYVVSKMRAAGYTVRKQTFTFPFFRETAETTLTQLTPEEQAARDRDLRVLRQWRHLRPGRADQRLGHPGNAGAEQHLRL